MKIKNNMDPQKFNGHIVKSLNSLWILTWTDVTGFNNTKSFNTYQEARCEFQYQESKYLMDKGIQKLLKQLYKIL